MAIEWYHTRSGQKYGPFTDQQFKQRAIAGVLQPNDLVWKTGATEWVPASRVQGLFPQSQSNQPPSVASPMTLPASARRPPAPLPPSRRIESDGFSVDGDTKRQSTQVPKAGTPYLPIAQSNPPPPPRAPVATENRSTLPNQTVREINVVAQWYYSKGGQQVGPVSMDKLKQLAASGQLQHADLAWTEGQADWVPAGQIKGIFAAPPPMPVPLPPLLSSRQSAPASQAWSNSGQLPRVQPVAAWGYFMCGIGIVWTIICYCQVCNGLSKLNPNRPLHSWTWFVPFYCNIYLGEIIQSLNEVITRENLNIQHLNNNVVLNFLFPFVPIYRIFQCYANLVETVESR